MILILDTIAGALLATVCLLAWRRRRTTAVFALAATVAWFATPALPALAVLHRPLLLHAILAFPRGGVRGVLARTLLVVAWAGVMLPPHLQPWASVVTAVLCVAVAIWPLYLRAGASQPGEVPARRALLVLAAALVLPVLERWAWPTYVEPEIPLATYLSAISLCALALISGILDPGRDEDAVIELSDRSPSDALSELRRLAQQETDRARARALASAIELLEDNARLHQDLAERIEEVRASRARLVRAAVDERQRLEGVLTKGALVYLNELAECLRHTQGQTIDDPTVVLCLQEIAHMRDDVEQLAQGLHPRNLTERGLAAALNDLASHSPIPVEITAPTGRFTELIETTLWYACAEALTNVWKHAQASRAAIEVSESASSVRAAIVDDGVGGASLAPGGGLAGLVDRVSVADGRITLTSSSTGTELTVEVPR